MGFESSLSQPNQAPPLIEGQPKMTRVYVDAEKKTYVTLNAEVARKIEELLESQRDIDSTDVERLFSASDSVAGANCHKTALFLEGTYSKEQLFKPDNDQLETAGHQDVEQRSTRYANFDDFREALTEREFPYRVSFFNEKDGKPFAYHSITVLGMTSKGTLVAFEKAGPYADTPFRYVDGMEIIMLYLAHGYVPALETLEK